VFALCEGGKPFELHPADLTTLGERDLMGSVVMTFNPHPHRVPAHAATYSIGTRRGREPALDVYKLPDHGAPQRIGTVPTPRLAMAHDFAVTQRHIVVVVPPFRLQMLPFLLRRRGFVDCLEWDASRGADLLIIPIAEPSAAFRVTVDACFVEHFANAWEEDGQLVVDCVRYPDFQTLDRFVLALGHGDVRGSFGNTLARYTVDLRTRRARTEMLMREPHELPQVAPATVGSRSRFVYLVGYANARASGIGLWDSILKVDTVSGAIERFTPGSGSHPFEPLFVPRAGGTGEDDGYLLVHVADAANGRSYETVLDARRISDGPIARLEFPDPLPVRLHGAFAAS
jgi:all-trans-8'-apo-beta-carotenal 15,15'-oxygenase